MNKHIRLLFMLSSIIIFNTKAEVETFVDIIETPAEIYNRCKQDIDTMNPDNGETIKDILKIAVKAVNMGIKQIEPSINTALKKQNQTKTIKESIFFTLKRLLTLHYDPINNLSWSELSICSEEASYKMKTYLISKKIKELFGSLSKHDQAIVRGIYDCISTKIKYQQKASAYRHLHLNIFYNYNDIY